MHSWMYNNKEVIYMVRHIKVCGERSAWESQCQYKSSVFRIRQTPLTAYLEEFAFSPNQGHYLMYFLWLVCLSHDLHLFCVQCYMPPVFYPCSHNLPFLNHYHLLYLKRPLNNYQFHQHSPTSHHQSNLHHKETLVVFFLTIMTAAPELAWLGFCGVLVGIW